MPGIRVATPSGPALQQCPRGAYTTRYPEKPLVPGPTAHQTQTDPFPSLTSTGRRKASKCVDGSRWGSVSMAVKSSGLRQEAASEDAKPRPSPKITATHRVLPASLADSKSSGSSVSADMFPRLVPGKDGQNKHAPSMGRWGDGVGPAVSARLLDFVP
ncbi:hypothetical protein PLICRDRAFT_46457 [Plicaturopsis crispa FD-325 SS-3]|uniref:Uncharacterized protein n=1 Tax=Plicaturopsis crispa FD-325 SS-3 TaxID=944288 RepID=A0A0C9T7F1_PLICR|nr:hypothetical protein PLICRDRAFT_46457 [Plicaturopsis crispa FD-325 SS-3]